jgi:chromosome segregation ATPase
LELEYTKLESNNQILERRILTNGKIFNDNVAIKAELEEKLDDAVKEVNRLQSCLKTSEENHESETKKLRNEILQSHTESKKQLATLKMQLVGEQERAKVLEQRCSETHEHAMKHINQLANDLDQKRDNDCTEKLLIAQDQIVKLENTITLLQNDKIQASRDHDAECHRLQHAIETCHQELSLALIERREAMQTSEAEKARAEQLQRDLATSEVSLKKCEHKCQLLEEEKSRLLALSEDRQHQNESLSNELRVLSEKTKESQESSSKARLEADEVRSFCH